MRVYISVPMRGRTDAEILNERRKAIEIVKADNTYEDIKVINNFFGEESRNDNPLWCLGESLKKLSTADLAFFADGWQDARGCRIEFECAVAYGIKFMMAI